MQTTETVTVVRSQYKMYKPVTTGVFLQSKHARNTRSCIIQTVHTCFRMMCIKCDSRWGQSKRKWKCSNITVGSLKHRKIKKNSCSSPFLWRSLHHKTVFFIINSCIHPMCYCYNYYSIFFDTKLPFACKPLPTMVLGIKT